MNRIEIVAVFKALNRLNKKGDTEGVQEVIDAVLEEAQTKTNRGNLKDDE